MQSLLPPVNIEQPKKSITVTYRVAFRKATSAIIRLGKGGIRTMKYAAMIAIMILTIGTQALAAKNAPSVVDSVDLNRYVGLWYSIASIPTTFERSCVAGTTAEYTLLEDGQIQVVNTCYTSKGKKQVATGRAWIPDKDSQAKLKVSFVKFLWFWLFPGDYWIIVLDQDYQYAVVGHPSYKYGWILSRTPEVPDDTLAQITSCIKEQGYQFSDFKFIDQSMNIQATDENGCSP
jgi:apolipoprotein D and lipocalin family protein